ncbi:similar to Saccharomyces cerevisiae YPL189C-A COA2 Cytochrome oxidase assembly factor [Maudiozyma saulgeensis]|uniref:Similar to Saccharomyces cerevisiae YPL189C-A COA2 Cytochrome oxidase assembly factor n=1 Tax=Maudiozyma saulgeensis TaxID=1789683 RepID=A0A1X7RAS2_9SACH|nr:similar to Saccharomyces cerevisiae YPL189C-A COA2 Cytochrome oxidase assembly factor [Kazachstania saulgeensis]
MKAVTRNKVINNLYLSTFLIAFGSVALASVLPCPAHTVSSDTPEEMSNSNNNKKKNMRTVIDEQVLQESKK